MKNVLCTLLAILLTLSSCQNMESGGSQGYDDLSQKLDAALDSCKKYQSIPTDTFEKYSRLAVSLASEVSDVSKLNRARLHRATYYFNVASYDSSLHLCDLIAAELPVERDSLNLLNKVDILRGTILFKRGHYKEALDFFFDIMPRIENSNAPQDRHRLYNNIGVCNVQLMRYEDAIRWYKKNLELPDSADIILKAAAALNISEAYVNMDMVDSALKYAQVAIEVSAEHNLLLIKANSLNTTGKILNLQGKVDEAIRLVEQSIEIRKQLGDPNYVIADLIQLSYLYKNKAWFDKGVEYAEEALRIAEDNGQVNHYYSIASVLFENYYHNKKYQEAAEAIFNMMNVMYQNNINATSDAIAELEVKYEMDKKMQLIKEQELELERKNLMLYGSIIIFILIIAVIYFAYLTYKNKQAQKLKNIVIREQNLAAKAVIQAQEQERSQISQKLHDGVGQTLSGLKMNLQALNEYLDNPTDESKILDNSLLLINDAIEEMRTISHQLIPNNVVRLGLKTSLEMLAKKINTDLLNVSVDIRNNVNSIDSDLQLMVYRILQESINNVIKHSRAQNLSVSLCLENERLYVSVKDDGVGFDISEIKLQTGIGLSNIYTRVRFMKGNIKIKSEFHKGTHIAFDFPLDYEQ